MQALSGHIYASTISGYVITVFGALTVAGLLALARTVLKIAFQLREIMSILKPEGRPSLSDDVMNIKTQMEVAREVAETIARAATRPPGDTPRRRGASPAT